MSESQLVEEPPTEQPNVDRLNYLTNSFVEEYPSLGDHGSVDSEVSFKSKNTDMYRIPEKNDGSKVNAL